MEVYVVITVTKIMLLRYSGPCVTSVYMLVGDHLPLRDFGPHGILDLRFSKLEYNVKHRFSGTSRVYEENPANNSLQFVS
jgi:hypothetical protein